MTAVGSLLLRAAQKMQHYLPVYDSISYVHAWASEQSTKHFSGIYDATYHKASSCMFTDLLCAWEKGGRPALHLIIHDIISLA